MQVQRRGARKAGLRVENDSGSGASAELFGDDDSFLTVSFPVSLSPHLPLSKPSNRHHEVVIPVRKTDQGPFWLCVLRMSAMQQLSWLGGVAGN